MTCGVTCVILQAMDINTSPIYTESAYVRRAEDEEGFVKKYGKSLNDYTSEIQSDNNIEETTNEEIQRFIDVASSAGDIYVRIPEDMFTFQNEESKQSYIDAVVAFLDSTDGYFEFSKTYANASSFPIPNSPRFVSEWLYRMLYNDLRPNAEPVVPYVHNPKPLGPNQEPEEYFDLEIVPEGDDTLEPFKCKAINLINGLQICFLNTEENNEVSFVQGIEPHTMATVILALGIVNQEYPTVIPKLVEHFAEIAETYGTPDAIRAHIEEYLKNTEPVLPAKKYPYQSL